MQTNSTNLFQLIGLAILGYVLLLVGHGYVFGHLGMIETLPYLKKIADPSLYPNDFYLDGIQAHFPDVRWIFVRILSILGVSGAWAAFFAHLVVSLFLLVGMLKLAQIFTQHTTTAFLVVMMTLLILYNHNLGGNELYYNSLAPSLVAKSIGVWSLYFFFKDWTQLAIGLLIPATLIHPMVGIQLFLLAILIIGLMHFWRDKQQRLPWLSIFFYVIIAGGWVVFLQRSFSDQPVASAKIFEILKFRLGHHYFPSTYGLGDFAFFVPYFLFGWWYFWRRNTQVFWFYTFALLGLLVYTIGVELVQIPSILSAQWFKTTIWLKFFSSIALIGFLEEHLIEKKAFLRKSYTVLTFVLFFGLGTFLFMKLPQRHPTTLDLPWRAPYNDRTKIALLAKAKTPKDALFITPTDFTHLKYFGERSTYVDYKATIHFRSKLLEWYQRIGDVYISESTEYIDSHQRLAQKALKLPTTSAGIKHLRELGITHLIIQENIGDGVQLIGQEGDYRLYWLVFE